MARSCWPVNNTHTIVPPSGERARRGEDVRIAKCNLVMRSGFAMAPHRTRCEGGDRRKAQHFAVCGRIGMIGEGSGGNIGALGEQQALLVQELLTRLGKRAFDCAPDELVPIAKEPSSSSTMPMLKQPSIPPRRGQLPLQQQISAFPGTTETTLRFRVLQGKFWPPARARIAHGSGHNVGRTADFGYEQRVPPVRSVNPFEGPSACLPAARRRIPTTVKAHSAHACARQVADHVSQRMRGVTSSSR